MQLPDPRDPGSSGLVTGSNVLQRYGNMVNQLGLGQQSGEELTDWDKWRRLFLPLDEEVPEMPSPLLDTSNVPPQYLGDQRERQRRESIYLQRVREHEQALRDRAKQREERGEMRGRLKSLATQYFGREPTPAEMQKLWAQAVDEAEAASLIGIEQEPWDALELMANSEDRPGAGQGPRTSTTTHTTLNLTDPETAKGIIQTSLRDALGRRATDEEVAQFTAALNAAEEANPTVSTTTSTTTPEGNTTSDTQTTGGAPSPTAVANSWLDDELNAEIDVYRAGTEYFEVAQALAGGVV